MEDKLYSQWLVAYANMDKNTFISFSEYKDKYLNNKSDIDYRDTKDIIEDILNNN